MARAVESKGGTYMGQDRPDHLEVGQAAAAWAERRGRELGDVLREWATEWVGVANTRSARSWRSWASAKASGTPWSSKGRASGMVRLHADLSTIKDFGDADIPVDEGKRVIGYG